MAQPAGEADSDALAGFRYRRLELEFHGSGVISLVPRPCPCTRLRETLD